MDRAPNRAKATNILRPASRAQGATFSPDPQLKQQQQQQQFPMHQPPVSNAPLSARVLPGGARLLVSSAAGGPSQPLVGMPGMPLNSPGLLWRAPSAAQFSTQPADLSVAAGFGGPDHQQQQPLSSGVGFGGRNRLSSYNEATLPGFGGDSPAAVPRSASRSGSRAEPGPLPHMMGQQMQQLPVRSSSRAGYQGAPGTAAPGIGVGVGVGVGAGGMWGGQLGQMGMHGMFGGGFGSLGGDMMNPSSPMALQQQQQMMMMMNMPLSGRPGSSLQMAPQPARPATSTGFRSSAGESDSPMVVNVARGGARVIGPMRAKPSNLDQPSFLNPIPQSPSSALGALIPEPKSASSQAARDHIRSALSNNSLDSTHSRSNSMQPPTEESMEAAEARVSRKIQDLEISNKSLLAINTQLEARVKTQRDQINELKKQLQMREPLISESLLDNDTSDEALRSSLKEDKVFERLISNLEHLIQDAKAAIEYRSTLAAGKVINTMDMNEDDSQLTVGKSPESQAAQEIEGGADTNKDHGEKIENGSENEENDDANENENENENDNKNNENENKNDNPKDEDGKGKPEDSETSSSGPAVDDARLQEARELVARLMVLALSSPEPSAEQLPALEKTSSRIPRRTGSGPSAAAAAGSTARPSSALKGGLRTPARSSGTRISSFGVASASTPVRSAMVSPTPSGKASSTSGGGKDSQGAASEEREQILDICRKLQQIL